MGTDLHRAWDLHPQVAIREEAFGALAYHYGNRRLSFLKSSQLGEALRSLARHPNPLEACRSSGVPGDQLPSYEAALVSLAESGMIVPRISRNVGEE